MPEAKIVSNPKYGMAPDDGHAFGSLDLFPEDFLRLRLARFTAGLKAPKGELGFYIGERWHY